MPAKPSSGYAYLTTPTHKHTPTHIHTHAQIDETIHNVGDSSYLAGKPFPLLSFPSSLHLLPSPRLAPLFFILFRCFPSSPSLPASSLLSLLHAFPSLPSPSLPPARAELNFHFHFASGVSCRPLPPLPPPCLLCPRLCCCVCPC